MRERILEKSSVEAQNLLWSGSCVESGDTYRVIADELIAGRRIRFKLIQSDELPHPGFIRSWLISIRAISLTATFTPCLAVLLLALAQGRSIHVVTAVCALLGVICLQIAVNVLNDVQDHLRLIDLPGSVGGSGVIQKGWIAARSLNRFGYGTLALGVLLGLPALIANPALILGVGALAVLGVMGYSGWPFHFKYRALGDLVVWVLCGPAITAGFAVASWGGFSRGDLILGAVLGLGAVAILHANNLNDLEVDRDRGARTLAGKLGFTRSKQFLVINYLALFVVVWDLARISWVVPLVTMLGIFPALRILRTVSRASGPLDPSIRLIRFQTAQLHLLIGLLLCVGIGITWGFGLSSGL
ncbi:MAG: prenyltransferase [Methylotenera sp.]|nr:prenyltransferase [Oligoflexia bacterium]